ncbi:MAG: protein-export chaperone SecB [Sphingomonadales bacterium]|nr:protein-export chaperone SecB [Sphingomonadales bacterium]
MNDKDNGQAGEAPVGASATTDAPQAGILGQYIKDLSFENPNAPETLQQLANAKPKIDVNVNVNGRKLNDEVYEVSLSLSASATHEESSAFVVELVYAGLFGLKNVPQDQLQPFLLVMAPQLLFPFARRVIADATRDGGFPPLMLDPIDFAGLYRQQLEQAQANATAGGGDTPTPANAN